MLNIRDLERRWLKYKIKSYAPYLGAVFTILLVSLIAFYNSLSSTVANEEINLPLTENSSEIKANNTETVTILEPSMDFVQSFQTTIPETQIATAPAPQRALPPQQSIPVPKVLNIPSSTSIKAPPPAISPLSGDKSLSLNRNESKLDIESVERRFKETSNPNLGLFIARYHYDHGNYSEAYNFSLKTNSMNSKIDESWIIFAKSLVKLGRVEQAKKTLHLYISESNSESARSLLDSIEQGTFK
ncbi:MAG: CDC27 family protein [Sulfuricurvum sp.]|uniref:CDC27 family protein n=2 Tax=Sulfuricurvum sp. TaxID=2025608 RepID=UPI002734B6D3|nr:CDC27 family protein [Sulfuricurvum sp.]MDP2851586.1 CDC27 family protein [Sulfuricurvum sp.]